MIYLGTYIKFGRHHIFHNNGVFIEQFATGYQGLIDKELSLQFERVLYDTKSLNIELQTIEKQKMVKCPTSYHSLESLLLPYLLSEIC